MLHAGRGTVETDGYPRLVGFQNRRQVQLLPPALKELFMIAWFKSVWASIKLPSIFKYAKTIDIEELTARAIPAVAEVNRIKQQYKEAELLDNKRKVIVAAASKYLEGQSDSNVVAFIVQLLYSPSSAMWTELAVLITKHAAPQFPEKWIRVAVPLAWAILSERPSAATVAPPPSEGRGSVDEKKDEASEPKN